MKINIFVLLIISSFFLSNAQKKEGFGNYNSVTEQFFQENITISSVSKYKKYKGLLYSKPSKLDSLLKEKKYSITKIFDSIPFYSDGKKSVIFLIKTGQMLEYSEFEKDYNFFNYIIVVFREQSNGSFLMSEYFHTLLNQGSWNLLYTNIIYKEKCLFIQQFGGNQFGVWGTELVFTFDKGLNTWIHSKSNIYTVVDQYDFSFKKLIWDEIPKRHQTIDEVSFTNSFSGELIESIIDGVYE